jgi:hypothetical protein
MVKPYELQDTGHTYKATVDNEDDLESPVVVTSGDYTVRFDGNNFAKKHLRRIRRNSVSELTRGNAGKLYEYIDEATHRAGERFPGSDQASSTLVFLDLGQFCQFGCQVIKFLAGDTQNQWQPYPPGAATCKQKHADITINHCFASTNAGLSGNVRQDEVTQDRLQHGIGIQLRVTLMQPLNGNGKTVTVCHYAGGTVKSRFAHGTATSNKASDLVRSIITPP